MSRTSKANGPMRKRRRLNDVALSACVALAGIVLVTLGASINGSIGRYAVVAGLFALVAGALWANEAATRPRRRSGSKGRRPMR